MDRQFLPVVLLAVSSLALMLSGCRTNQGQQPLFGAGYQNFQNNGLAAAGQPPANPGASQFQTQPMAQPGAQLANQVGTLNSRLNQFDSDNQNLHAQVAALQQRLQNANSYNDQLRTQLSDQMSQLQQAQVRLQQNNSHAQQQISAAQSAARNAQLQNAAFQNQTPGNVSSTPSRFTGASLGSGVSSLAPKLNLVQLPGFKSWMDGDVIRIEGPTDRLFVSGTYQINQNDGMTLARLASTIRQQFPRQVIGVEAHWDGSAIQPATTSHHQMTANQALAAFDLLVKSGLPHDQVFTMAVGSNRLRYPAGNTANRRIEIVIYPETF